LSKQQEKYLRFELLSKNSATGKGDGIFVGAYALVYFDVPAEFAHDQIIELIEWFKKNLAVPPRLNTSKSKGWYRREPKGVAWFKPNAHDHIAKARELMSLMAENGIHTRMRTTSRPGYVVYEDAHQLIAEPFHDDV
jgi:hypothetical protein